MTPSTSATLATFVSGFARSRTSPGPELGIVHDGLRQLLGAHDVRDGEPAPRAQRSEDLLDDAALPK
ncbi:MAG: hypothetical protein ABIV11_04030 [Gemmatimonadaceae bacterium]